MSISQRLAARAHARQHQAHRHANACGRAADRAIVDVWRELLAALKRYPDWTVAPAVARSLFARMIVRGHQHTGLRLLAVADWSWRSAVYALKRSLPQRTLLRAAQTRRLTEDETSEPSLTFTDLVDLLFPAPSPADIHRIVFGGDWGARLASLSRLAPPFQLAGIVGAGLAAGKSQQEIARELMPAVNRVRASARRIARTEALRVAGQMQMQAHEQLGDLVIGYTIHSAHVPDSRSWHVQRSGTTYWRNPRPGQKGYHQLPHPPDEAADPSERPPGTPQTAPNCLCYLTPVLRD